MTCTDTEPLLAAGADGLLDADRRARLDAHLAGCDACRAALEDQRQVAAILASAVADEVSPAFLERLNGRIDESDDWLEVVDFRRWTLRLAPVAAMLVVAAVLGIGLRSSSSGVTAAQSALTSFSPTDAEDWNRDVSADALIDAALRVPNGETHAR